MFPFNIRAVLLGWRILFFHPGPIKYAKSWSPAVRNGAYIAEALGHCGECHSPRNFMFAVRTGSSLAGSPILGESWYAPNISSSKRYGVGAWKQQDLVSFLHNGGNMVNGSAFGPMKSVVDYSLSKLPKSDIDDLAQYLQQATRPRRTPRRGKLTPRTRSSARRYTRRTAPAAIRRPARAWRMYSLTSPATARFMAGRPTM